MRTKQYRLAVQGRKNLTPVGPRYSTRADAIADAPVENRERQANGLKPVVAIKRYNGSSWVFECWLKDDDGSVCDAARTSESANYDARGLINDPKAQEEIGEYYEALANELFATQLASVSNLSLQGYSFSDAVEASMTLDTYYLLDHDARIKVQQAWIYPSDPDTGESYLEAGHSSAIPHPNPQGHTPDSIEDTLDTLRKESRSCYDTNKYALTFEQSEAAAMCHDEWRYLLHSVDGLNA